MKITEIKNQFSELLNIGLRVYINLLPIVRNDPQFPNIKIESINTSNLKLDDDDIDVLIEGKELFINAFNTIGIYWATDKEMNVSKQMNMNIHVQSLLIQIENEKLVIKDCKCYATIK